MRSGINPLLIESHEEDGIEWGVSFDGHNPDPVDYIAVKDRESAEKLIDKLNNLK